jgi:uncharacterized protein
MPFKFNKYYLKSAEDSLFAIRHAVRGKANNVYGPVARVKWDIQAKSVQELFPYISLEPSGHGGIFAIELDYFLSTDIAFFDKEIWGRVEKEKELVFLLEFSSVDVVSRNQNGEIALRQCNVVWYGNLREITSDYVKFFTPLMKDFCEMKKEMPLTEGIKITNFYEEIYSIIRYYHHLPSKTCDLIELTLLYAMTLRVYDEGRMSVRIVHWYSLLRPLIPTDISENLVNERISRTEGETGIELSPEEKRTLYLALTNNGENEDVRMMIDAFHMAEDAMGVKKMVYRDALSNAGRYAIMVNGDRRIRHHNRVYSQNEIDKINDEKIRSFVREIVKLGATSDIHGISHWMRVEFFGVVLCGEIKDADFEVVKWFAYLHDCRRQNDGADIEHGKRAADYIDNIRQKYLYHLTDSQIDKLKTACALHTTTHKTGDSTIDACFDADRLDLQRVGIKPDPAKMATEAGAKMAHIDSEVLLSSAKHFTYQFE